jgi:hypothetical protein
LENKINERQKKFFKEITIGDDSEASIHDLSEEEELHKVGENK